MKPLDPCLIDTSIGIEAQRNPGWFAGLIADLPESTKRHARPAEPVTAGSN
ncbi:MAG: hypothetical protein WCK27_30110 [Verrucomicrobiota bacterium]